MPTLMQALEQHLIKSLPEYVAIFGLFMIAVVVSMPHKDVVDKWLGAWQPVSDLASWRTRAWQKFRDLLSILYGWMYDSIQGFMASRNPPPPAQFSQSRTTTPTQTTETLSSSTPVPDPNALTK